MTAVVAVSAALLLASAVLCVAAAVRHQSIPDRAIALDSVVAVIACGLAAGAVASGDGTFSDVVLVLGLLGFIASSAIARYLGSREP